MNAFLFVVAFLKLLSVDAQEQSLDLAKRKEEIVKQLLFHAVTANTSHEFDIKGGEFCWQLLYYEKRSQHPQ